MDIKEQLKEIAEIKSKMTAGMATEKDLLRFADYVLNLFNKLKTDIKDEIGENVKELSGRIRLAFDIVKGIEEDLKKENIANLNKLSQQIDKLTTSIYSEITLIRNDIPTLPDLTYLEEMIRGIKIPQIPEVIPVKELRENFKKIGERLDDLENEIENVKKIKPINTVTNHSIVGRDIIQPIDISSQLDGVTKTFNIQAIYTIVSVSLSSYPYGSLRNGIDFTYTPTSITFTSEIDAETQLSSGQKCIIIAVLA